MTVPYTPDHTMGDGEWDEYQARIQVAADAYAWAALRYLTGQRVGNEAVLLRPCIAARCSDWGWEPHVRDGQWYNACPHTNPDTCSCGEMSVITMPGEVAEILNVWEDGNTLTAGTDFRELDGSTRLVRLGGTNWLSCQDFGVAHNAEGALSVHYVPGVKPTDSGLIAAGTLALEFAKALQGQKCSLPRAITSMTRQGISLDFQEGYFPNNVTGMIVVDTYVHSLNPNAMRKPATVWSPDLPQGHTTAAP